MTDGGSTTERLVSLDAFRGIVMLFMSSNGLGIPQAAAHFPQSDAWQQIAGQLTHAEWVGCTAWDLIQPAFMFMVGVALPWSISNRKARGESPSRRLGHALLRSFLLVLLAVFLTSAGSQQTEWVFTMVLAQIGLGYPFLYLLAGTRPRTQAMAALGILSVYWLAFALHPLPPSEFDRSSVGLPSNWEMLTGFEAHWQKNANFAASFDTWFLNLFPREKPFEFNPGGYATLNFIPSLATMIFGAIAGAWLRTQRPAGRKAVVLAAAGLLGLLLGKAIGESGLCPIVKRIWTPSWAIFSAGWVCCMLAAFVAVIEAGGWRRWAFPLVVAGLNPITLYCLWQLSGGFLRDTVKTHFGQGCFGVLGEAYAPILERAAVLFLYWLILFGMYRRRIFLRL
jgi:heparan-alpha-glucosaminide N-acetyltransferase